MALTKKIAASMGLPSGVVWHDVTHESSGVNVQTFMAKLGNGYLVKTKDTRPGQYDEKVSLIWLSNEQLGID